MNARLTIQHLTPESPTCSGDLRRLRKILASGRQVTVSGDGSRAEKVPDYLVEVMEAVINAVSAGKRLALVDEGGVLSVSQGAKLAGVTKSFFEQLLDDGLIPSSRHGDRRRVAARDVLAFLEKRQSRMAALDALNDEVISAGVSQCGGTGR